CFIDLSLSDPYSDLNDIITKVQSQVDSQIGASETLIFINENNSLVFLDIPNRYVSTFIDPNDFTTFSMPILTRQKETYQTYQVTNTPNPSPAQGPGTSLKLNGISNLYEILPSINQI